jgi:hypothetical protein
MSNLLIILGPPAAGKTAVGTEIAKRTGYRLFHNHLTAEPAAAIFGWGTPRQAELATEYRLLAFRRVLESAEPIGLLFTFVWGFDLEADNSFVDQVVAAYSASGRQVFFLELAASLEARIAREGTPLRMALKPSKQDVERSRALHEDLRPIRMSSDGRFPYPERHFLLDAERHAPPEAARLAIERFELPSPAVRS